MMVRKYQNKYEQVYFNRNNDLNNWKNYKAYLQELLKKDQMEPYLRRANTNPQWTTEIPSSPLRKTSQSRNYQRLRTEPTGLTRIDE